MILSMTGFGDAEGRQGEWDFAVEIRSVNHRYYKANIKLPEFLQSFESEIDKLLREQLGRGSINYQLKVKSGGLTSAFQINAAVLNSYLQQVRAVLAQSRLPESALNISDLLALPGVCVPPDNLPDDREALWSVISNLTGGAIEKLMRMRRGEGQALAQDLLANACEIRRLGQVVAQRAPQVVHEYQTRLKLRVNELLAESNLSLNQNDLLREIAIFAERSDISEEITRLISHLDQFDELCRSNEYAGRKLDFMAQEMLREVNTIGSKSGDVQIARQVVEMKALIDRLKEQVQNVE